MKIKKDSLLVKLVFYNDLVIFLTAVIIAFVIVVTSFQSLEKRIEDGTKSKMQLLVNAYNIYFSKVQSDVYKEIGKYRITAGNQEIAEKLKKSLLTEDFRSYYSAVVTILSPEGKLLGESGNSVDLGTLTDKNIWILIENYNKKEIEEVGYYFVQIKNKIYARVIIPYGTEKVTNYVVVSIPIDNDFFKELKGYLSLGSKDKIVFLSNKVIDKNISIDQFFTKKEYKKLIEMDGKDHYINKRLNGNSFYMGVHNIVDYEGRYLGSCVIARSKNTLLKDKIIVSLYIASISIIIILLFSTISTKLFKKLLLPLGQIAEVADRISNGVKIKNMEIIGQGEIRRLSISFKEMIERLDVAQKDLQTQNKELLSNIDRIHGIDNILMEINTESDIDKIIKILLDKFVSPSGLGYGRAMYFRYSRENDYFIGEDSRLNGFLEIANTMGFEFQIKDLKELVLFTKISALEDSLVKKAFDSRKIIAINDKGYRYNMGSDLLKAIGLNNFFIFPIYGIGKYSGVIIVDNYVKEDIINKEELELLNLLALNFSVSVKNKENTKKLLENQRIETIEKLATRFMKGNLGIIDEIVDILNSKTIAMERLQELKERKEELSKIIKDRDTLKKYYNLEKKEVKKISIEELINRWLDKNKNIFYDKNIELSFFSSTPGIVIFNEEEMERVLEGILDNAYKALMLKSDDGRKVNIILSQKRLNNKVELKIIDNGIGISEECLNKIYDPFMGEFENTLGLSLFFIKKAIKNYDGVIKHFSKVGKYTEVRITLNSEEPI